MVDDELAADPDDNPEFADDGPGEEPIGADALEEGEAGEKKKLSGKKIIIFIILPLILLLGGGGILYVTGALDSFLQKDTGEVTKKAGSAKGEGYEFTDTPGYFYEISDIIVNLNSTGKNQRFLKLSVTIELDKEQDVKKIEEIMPRVNDHFQTYLRELRISDLKGSAGIYRLRQELLSRVRAAAYPVPVRDVLFSEILVQ